MNGTFQVVSPREFPVRLGNLTFYAAGWKLSGTDSTPSRAVYREQPM